MRPSSRRRPFDLKRLLWVWCLLRSAGARLSSRARDCLGSLRHVTLSIGPLDPDGRLSMLVSFASISSQYLDVPFAAVRYGTSPLSLDKLAWATETSHYNISHVNDVHHANVGDDAYFSPYYHFVTIPDLSPETMYYYKPVVAPSEKAILDTEKSSNENNRNLRSRLLVNWPPYDSSAHPCPDPRKVRSFRTAPTGNKPTTLALVGDMGQFPHSGEVLERMQRERDRVHALVLAGDVAYTSGDHNRWDMFLDFLDDYSLTDHVPLLLCPGNHDIDKTKKGKEIFLAYQKRFRMAQVKPAELGFFDGQTMNDGSINMDNPPYPLPFEWGNAYYAVTVGMARIVMINAYSSVDPGSVQYDWIQKELQGVDRTKTPWLLAVLHTPMYNTFGLHTHDTQMRQARVHLEPLFVEHKVNIVVSGHIHAYQRTHQVVNGTVSSGAPMHMTVGAGGRKCEAPFAQKEAENWLAVRDATFYGYGRLHMESPERAVWEWIHTGDTDEGRTYNQLKKNDTVHLEKGPVRDVVVIQNYALPS